MHLSVLLASLTVHVLAARPAQPGAPPEAERNVTVQAAEPVAATASPSSPVVTPAPGLIATPGPPPRWAEHQHGFTLWRPEALQDGQILAIEIEPPRLCATAEVEWLGLIVPLHRAGERWGRLLPVPLGTSGERRLVVRCGGRAARFRVPVREGEYPESKLTVDPKFTQPPPPRARVERETITEAYKRGAAEQLWSAAFLRPAPGVETSLYGVRRTFNAKLASRHQGIDYDGRTGDPVYAANDGVVVLAAPDYYYTGNAVFLDHGSGLFTVYYHLSQLDVKTGDRVQRGQKLGLLGATGRVTGPHLHFGVKLLGYYINPHEIFALRSPGETLQAAGAPAPPE